MHSDGRVLRKLMVHHLRKKRVGNLAMFARTGLCSTCQYALGHASVAVFSVYRYQPGWLSVVVS
jgi:hypothetical protein